jgi:hypothetical protein
MSKVIIEVPVATGDIYEFRSNLISRSMSFYMSKSEIKDEKDDKALLAEIVKQSDAEWRINGSQEWQRDGWQELPLNVIPSWLKLLGKLSSTDIEARVQSEKN